MKELHTRNTKVLNEIIDRIGYPTFDEVGEEAGLIHLKSKQKLSEDKRKTRIKHHLKILKKEKKK